METYVKKQKLEGYVSLEKLPKLMFFKKNFYL